MITQSPFGQVDGRTAHSYLLDGGDGVSIRLTDYGARLVSLWAPGRDGRVEDVVLGFDGADAYAQSPCYFGATVGRYGNRLARGQFSLLGTEYQVDRNEGRNHLHGGRDGWDRRSWDAEPHEGGVTFRMTSEPGDMGFPGGCEVTTTYELRGSSLRITMAAIPSESTVINLVHHSYFNLAGHGSGTVLAQHLRLPSDFYVPVDDELLPTGEILAVEGTPFDFRELRPIGAPPSDPSHSWTASPTGSGEYDHNWCLRGSAAGLSEAAEAYDPGSGRRMQLWTTEPGVQVYTGGKLSDEIVGKGGSPYCRFAGFTLETQKFPDSPNRAHFPSTTVRAGDHYRHEMVFEFTAV
jgi:aldose 1-epimerase